mgnify:CR=1 FL=1
MTGLLPDRVRHVLTRRSLWGYLPQRTPAVPAGPPMLALTFDLDYQADTDALPALQTLVEKHGAAMTVYAIGRLVENDPGPYRAAAEAGHELANHTWSHPNNPVLNPDREFWDLGVDDMADEIGRCQDALERHTGRRPTSFRTPHFKDAPRMLDAVARFPELDCISTTLASKCPVPTPYFPTSREPAGRESLHFVRRADETTPRPPIMVPLTPCPGLRWSPFCSYSAIRRPANPAQGAGLLNVAEFERRWGVMLDRAQPRKFASTYFDPLDVMRDDETRTAFDRMLGEATRRGWVLTTTTAVAKRWRGVAAGGDA